MPDLTLSDPTSVYVQLGQVLSSLRALADTIEIRHAQAEKLHDLARADLATLRQDQRDLEEKLDCVIAVMQHDLQDLRTQSAGHAQCLADMVTAVRDLRQPVSEIVALRSRAAGLIFGLGVIGSTLLWLSEPVYRWFVEDRLRR